MMRNREKPAIPRKAFLFCFSLQAGAVTYASILFIIMVTTGLHNLTAEIRFSKSSYGSGIMYFYISLNILSLTFLSTGAFLLNERVVFFGTILVTIAACIWAIISILSLMYFIPAYEYLCVDERCPTTHWLFDEGFRTFTADCEKSKGFGGGRELDDQDKPTTRNLNEGNGLRAEEAKSEPVSSPVTNCLPGASSDNPIDTGRLQTCYATEPSEDGETEIGLTTTNSSTRAPTTIGVTQNHSNWNITTAKNNANRTATTFVSDDVSDERLNGTSSVTPPKTTESTTAEYDDFAWVTDSDNVWVRNPFKTAIDGVSSTDSKITSKTKASSSISSTDDEDESLDSWITDSGNAWVINLFPATSVTTKTKVSSRKGFDAGRFAGAVARVTENDNVGVNQPSETTSDRASTAYSVTTKAKAPSSSSTDRSTGKDVTENTTTNDLSDTWTRSGSMPNSSYYTDGYKSTKQQQSHADELKNKYIQQVLNILKSWGVLYRKGGKIGVSGNTNQRKQSKKTKKRSHIGALMSFQARYDIPEKYCRFTYLNFLWTFTLFLFYTGFTIYGLWACFAFAKELKQKREEKIESELE